MFGSREKVRAKKENFLLFDWEKIEGQEYQREARGNKAQSFSLFFFTLTQRTEDINWLLESGENWE